MTTTIDSLKAAAPSQEDQEAAKTVSSFLSDHLKDQTEILIRVRKSRKEVTQRAVITPKVAQLIVQALEKVVPECAVQPVSDSDELSTQQAAEILNVSRPFVVKLIKEKKLPARKVGTHRRIRRSDLMDYMLREERAREKVLRDLTKQAQELGLGY